MSKLNVLIFATVCLCAGRAEAGSPRRLKDFNAIMDGLRAGKEVRAVLDWGACRLAPPVGCIL